MSSLGEEVKDWLISIVVAVVLAFLIRQFVVELYIVDGGIWCVTNEGSENVTYQGFDNSYDGHVRECVFHCPGIGSKDKYAGMTDDHTEKILGQTNDTEYLFTYGEDGILKNCDGSGTHIEVLEFTDGIGSLQIPENVRAAIENKDLNG